MGVGKTEAIMRETSGERGDYRTAISNMDICDLQVIICGKRFLFLSTMRANAEAMGVGTAESIMRETGE
jgi:hypothetical protein